MKNRPLAQIEVESPQTKKVFFVGTKERPFKLLLWLTKKPLWART